MDSTILSFLAAPFAASLILTVIHAYLGVHVVERGVIFVDLALAQIAALGATLALVAEAGGHGGHTVLVYWVSLGFTLVGAAIFATVRAQRSRIPQEAVIGISYAVAAAAAILAMSKAPSETEHLTGMLVGNILAVSWPEVARTAALYACVGAFHYIFRKQFLAISVNHDRAAERPGLNVRWWDFLFYVMFGFVVTSFVHIGGVLLVFSYLIVPAVCATYLAHRLLTRLIVGWAIATVASVISLFVTAQVDLPIGAAIVCLLGLSLLAVGVFARLRPATHRDASVGRAPSV